MRRLLFAAVLLLVAAPAVAQPKDPIGPFVIDLRVGFAMLKADPVTAENLEITTDDLPGHSFAGLGGIHFYPVRRGGFAFGVGGELLLAGATGQRTDEEAGDMLGPKVRRRFRSLSGQLSFNFGHRQGWSYLTAGIGPVAFDTYVVPAPPAPSPDADGLRPMTQNFGFGARWFNTNHVAFELDLRFYLTVPANPTAIVGGRERTTVVVMSAGIGLK
jgi:hypothetical protein